MDTPSRLGVSWNRFAARRVGEILATPGDDTSMTSSLGGELELPQIWKYEAGKVARFECLRLVLNADKGKKVQISKTFVDLIKVLTKV